MEDGKLLFNKLFKCISLPEVEFVAKLDEIYDLGSVIIALDNRVRNCRYNSVRWLGKLEHMVKKKNTKSTRITDIVRVL